MPLGLLALYLDDLPPRRIGGLFSARLKQSLSLADRNENSATDADRADRSGAASPQHRSLTQPGNPCEFRRAHSHPICRRLWARRAILYLRQSITPDGYIRHGRRYYGDNDACNRSPDAVVIS